MDKETQQNTAPDAEKKIDDEILRLLSEREKIVMNAGASGSSGSTEEERRRAAEKYGLSQHMVSVLFRLIAENDASLRQYSLFRRASEENPRYRRHSSGRWAPTPQRPSS